MRYPVRKNTALYVETVLLVLFIMLSAGVLVRMFASAQSMGNRAAHLTQAVTLAQNAAETFSSAQDAEALETLLPQTDGACTQYYDAQGAPAASAEQGGYTVTVTITQTPLAPGIMSNAAIAVMQNGKSCYALDVARYWGGEGRAENGK